MRFGNWVILLLAATLACPSIRAADYDIVVYGGTSAGVIAAVQAKRMGKTALIVCPDKRLGGLSSGGLGFTDILNKGEYEIAYGALVPKKGQGDNLLVPVCVSASHIAFGSIRMEPVFMILGQSAAIAAGLALEGNLAVQDVPYPKLRERLLKDGQILEPRSGG